MPPDRPGERLAKDPASGIPAEASAVAAIVARLIDVDRDDRGQVEVIEAAITHRRNAAFSDIPAVRVELAGWLIRESGTDAPEAIDLWLAAAKEGVRELGRERAWGAAKVGLYEARLAEAFDGPLRRALVADEEKSVER